MTLTVVVAGIATGTLVVGAIVVALLRRRRAPALRGGRMTALIDGAQGRARETLLAIDRLTDPLAVQQRVVESLGEQLPGGRFELLRCSRTPRGSLIHARSVDAIALAEAVRREFLLVRRGDGLPPEVRQAVTALGGRLLIPVKCDMTLFGALLIEHDSIDRSMLLQARRIADLLGYKLETHRLHAEVEHGRKLTAMGQLAAAIAHDMRSPLSAMRMSVDMMCRQPGRTVDDLDYLGFLRRDTERLIDLANDMAELSNPASIRAVAPIPIREWIEQSIESTRAAFDEAGVRVRQELAVALPVVHGDISALRRALANILSNAASVAPRGSDVRVRARVVADWVEISVADRGPGIAREVLAEVFEPFFTTRSTGTGLGLAIVSRVMKAHGGTVTVDSQPGAGAEFHLRIAAHPPAPD